MDYQTEAKCVSLDSSVMLQAARQYVDDGLVVTPLNGKRPIIKVWQKQPMPTDADLVEWFGKRSYNVGLRCGLISRLAVIDIDGENGKREFLAVAKKRLSARMKDRIIWTRRTRTGSGGAHVLLRFDLSEFPNGVKSVKLWTGKGEHEGIELLGDGKVIVAPPSVHPDTGQRYVANDNPLQEIARQDYHELLAAFGKTERKSQVYRQLAEPNYSNTLTHEMLQKAVEIWTPDYRQGDRHNLILGIAGYSRKRGVPQQDMEKLTVTLCKATGDTEVEDRLRAVRDAYSRDFHLPIAGAQWLRGLLE